LAGGRGDEMTSKPGLFQSFS